MNKFGGVRVRRNWLIGAVLVALLGCGGAMAQDVPVKSWHACFRDAGAYYKIPPRLLAAIARTESHFDPRAFNHDSDGSVDVGLMQINSHWFPKLRARGIEHKSLMDPCTSIWVAAWILSENIRQFGYTWKAVGAYNAGGAAAAARYRQDYISKVALNLDRSGTVVDER